MERAVLPRPEHFRAILFCKSCGYFPLFLSCALLPQPLRINNYILGFSQKSGSIAATVAEFFDAFLFFPFARS